MLFKNYKKNTKLFYIVILFFIIFFLNNYQIYKKTFFLLSRDYEKRMVDEHGYCSRESFGFINYVFMTFDVFLISDYLFKTKDNH